MRVLLVSQEVPPETGWGGIGTYVDLMSRALAAKGVEVHVLSVVSQQPYTRTEFDGVTVHRFSLPLVRRPARYAPESWQRLLLAVTVARLTRLGAFKPDVIETPEWMAEGLGLAVSGSFPLVVRLHSSARQLFPYTGQGHRCLGLDGHLATRLEELAVRRANVVVSTRTNLNEVVQSLRLDEQALLAIPNPVRPLTPSPMPVGPVPRIMFAGRLEARKGPEIVLAAAPKVLAAVPDARFVFVGRDGVESGQFPSAAWLRREAARLGVEHAVECTGHLDRSGVENELRRATVCVYPSRWESFGYTVAEANAVGRPVVVSNIAAFRELVRDGSNGRIVSGDDSEAWSVALIELLQNREKAQMMGEAGARHVAATTGVREVANLTLSAYERARERWRVGKRAGISRLRLAAPVLRRATAEVGR